MTEVTIFLPCYNSEKFIDTCMISLLAQTHKDMIILAYDDFSTDSTLEHLLFWQQYDSRIIVKQPFQQQVGYIKLLNKMLTETDSKYICRQDSDDWSLPQRIEIQLKFMNEHNDCILLGTQGKNIWNSTSKLFIFPWERDYVNNIASYTQPVNEFIRSQHRIIHGSMCIKTEFLLKVGGYDVDLAPVEDWDLSLKLSSFGNIYILPEVLYIRRLHDDNTTKNHPNRKLALDTIVERYNLEGYQFKNFRSTFNML